MTHPTLNEDHLRTALTWSPATLTPGLTDDEFNQVETTFGFEFAPDHRVLLSVALPVGDSWPDWRTGDQSILRDQLDWPVRGILFDIEQNAFWHPDGGTRPSVTTEALAIGEERLRDAPPLAPLYGHRYLPTVPHEPGNPVLSVYQTDIIYYGNDLLDWLEYELRRTSTASTAPRDVPFWSWFVDSA